jgi:hypothetical protein
VVAGASNDTAGQVTAAAGNPAGNPAGQRRRDQMAGAGVPPGDKTRVASRAVADAGRLSTELRCQDPAEVWRTLARWGSDDPVRLVAVAFAAVAMTPDDRSHRDLLAWIDKAVPALAVVDGGR